MHLRDLQAKLPWAIPYTDAFRFSQDHEHHRNLIHDVLHVQKSLGKIANYCEQLDHNDRLLHPDYLLARRDALACEVVDLVICALHMAKTNPFGPFDLESEVLSALDRRNGSNLMEQEGHRP